MVLLKVSMFGAVCALPLLSLAAAADDSAGVSCGQGGATCLAPAQQALDQVGDEFHQLQVSSMTTELTADTYLGRETQEGGGGESAAGKQGGVRYPYDVMTCSTEPASFTTFMSKETYRDVVSEVQFLLNSVPDVCTATDCPQADWAGCVLRLAGHDFMDFDKGLGRGGSDACLDFEDPDNKGLIQCLKTGEFDASLQMAYEEFCGVVSLADYLVIAAEAVMSATRDNHLKANPLAPTLNFEAKFRYGRKTAKVCPWSSGMMPNPENGCSAVETTFLQRMGLDWAQAAALMGVHTLGRAVVNNSGYSGWWASPENSRMFNNNYYVMMAAAGWMPERNLNNNTGKNQWQRADLAKPTEKRHQMMLSTDLCLLYTNGDTYQRVGEHVNAKRDSCCAWTASNRIRAVVAGNHGQFCGGFPSNVSGSNPILNGGDEEHRFCCHAGEVIIETNETNGTNETAEDCGNFFRPESVASEQVLLYAANETAWLEVFQAAWTKATGNGFGKTLHYLSDSKKPKKTKTTTTTPTTATTTTTSTTTTTTTRTATTTPNTTTIIKTLRVPPMDAAVVNAGGEPNSKPGNEQNGYNVPTDADASNLQGVDEYAFTVKFLRFEELGQQSKSDLFNHSETFSPPASTHVPKRYDGALVTFLTNWSKADYDSLGQQVRLANTGPNPWEQLINTHLMTVDETNRLFPIPNIDPDSTTVHNQTSFADGRCYGDQFGHQRWLEFFPQRFIKSIMTGASDNTGMRDFLQRHRYTHGEFGPLGLYHASGTTRNIQVKFHTVFEQQDQQALWTFDGTFPPKLQTVRYGEPHLFRHYNGLPVAFDSNRGFGSHFISTHEHNGHTPAESDGYTQAYFLPGQHYDYHWPMVLAGHDSININASEPRAATPCDPGERMIISYPGNCTVESNHITCPAFPLSNISVPDSCTPNGTICIESRSAIGEFGNGWYRLKVQCPDHGTIKIPGDWKETMSTHWFHDHMLDFTAQNVYKGNAAMMNYYSALDRGNECWNDFVNLKLPSGCGREYYIDNRSLPIDNANRMSWGIRDYDLDVLIASKMWGQDKSANYSGGNCAELGPCQNQLWFSTFNTDGVIGDRMLTNWIYQPYLEVRPRRYRFRILNGDVSRFMRLALVVKVNESLGYMGLRNEYKFASFYMIANDGNLMKYAVPFGVNYDPGQTATASNANRAGILPLIAIAERQDIIVDFQQYIGSQLYLINVMDHKGGRQPEGPKTFEDSVQRVRQILSEEHLNRSDRTERFWNDGAVGKFMRFNVVSWGELYKGVTEDNSMDPAEYVEGNPSNKTLIPPRDHQITIDTSLNDDQPGKYKANGKDVQLRVFDYKRGGEDPLKGIPPGGPGTVEGPIPHVREDKAQSIYNAHSVGQDEAETYRATLVDNTIDRPWAIRTEFDLPNGKKSATGAYNMNVHLSSLSPDRGDIEVWRLEGNGGWMHNVHTHFEEGHIISRKNDLGGNGVPDWEKFARKDVYNLGGLLGEEAGDTITYSIRFRDFEGTFMSHCHNTQHEDHAMLQRWDVHKPGQIEAFMTPENQWNGCTYQASVEIVDLDGLPDGQPIPPP